MSRSIRLFTQVYSALLHLYPSQFRTEFADEMRTSFADAIADAATRGVSAIVQAFSCEVRDLPTAILHEYWREKRTMEARPDSTLVGESISWQGMLVAIVPLILLAIISLLNLFRLGGAAMPDWFGYVLLAILLLPFLIGLRKGIPLWCLPYFGMFASLASLLYVNSFFARVGFVRVSDPWIIRVVVGSGLPWIGLIIFTVLFVLITLVFPPLRRVYERIRRDWTVLSFGLYGAMTLGLSLTFEDYPMERGIYAIVAVLILVVGTCVYLRSSQVRQRALVLFTSITLAMTVATIGKALLAASPLWPFPGTPDWQAEAIGTVADSVWMLIVVLLIPALVNFLPCRPLTEATHS